MEGNFVFRSEGDIGQCRLQNEGDHDFIVLINKFNNKLEIFKTQFLQKYGSNQNIFPKFQWQKSYHDHVIRNEKDFRAHHRYTEQNFLKHDLPENWPYTSLDYKELVDEILI